MARKSLFLAFAMLSFTGCIVADPPEYEEPRRTPPILDLNHAEPSPYWIVVVDRTDDLDLNDKVEIRVPLRSDDQGERVWFGLHVDYKGEDRAVAPANPVAPSTIDDDSRSISTTWHVGKDILAGCHQLTLLVAHESSWDYGKQQPKTDAPKDDIAIATWWLNLDPPDGMDPFTLPGCPSQSEVQQ